MPGLSAERHEIVAMTREEWLAEGERLFGPDQFKWRFVCPICGNVQTTEDFRKHKDAGATTNTAYQSCIGRFEGGRKALGSDGATGSPCDYTAGGLLRFGCIQIEGWDYPIFDFDRSGEGGAT